MLIWFNFMHVLRENIHISRCLGQPNTHHTWHDQNYQILPSCTFPLSDGSFHLLILKDLELLSCCGWWNPLPLTISFYPFEMKQTSSFSPPPPRLAHPFLNPSSLRFGVPEAHNSYALRFWVRDAMSNSLAGDPNDFFFWFLLLLLLLCKFDTQILPTQSIDAKHARSFPNPSDPSPLAKATKARKPLDLKPVLHQHKVSLEVPDTPYTIAIN